MKSLLAFLLLAALGLPSAFARIDLLLVPPDAAVAPEVDFEFTVYLNNPTDVPEIAPLPLRVEADYASPTHRGRVALTVVGGGVALSVPAMHRVTVKLRLQQRIEASGEFVSLRLTDPASNAIMFRAVGPEREQAAAPAFYKPGPQIDLTSDIENMRRHISSYDPIYFAVGSRERFNARFQFSFKYRVFEQRLSRERSWKELGSELYLAYTQTSIWDLHTFSKPFYDSSYKPTIFLLHGGERVLGRSWTFSLQSGVQHESNGKGGTPASVAPPRGLVSPATPLRHPIDSRSLNTFYLLPMARWADEEGHFFEARLRGSAYFQKDENRDIAQYRGYTELTLRGGYDRGAQLSLHLRGQPAAHGSVEFNFTWPANQTPLLKSIDFLRTLGGYAQIQYFNGYGESLLDYDVRRKDQLRLGLMIVR